MKTLITGGAGFIGTNLVKRLKESNDELIVIDNFCSSTQGNKELKGIEVVKLDLADPTISTNDIFHGVDRIFHLAANVDNRFSWENPYVSTTSNIYATLNIALAARNFHIPQIIYSSTGTIYGDMDTPPFLESFESSRQTTLYGATKYAAEGLLSVFSTHYGIRTTVFRFVGVLGPYSSHGHLYDFIKKLRSDPTQLHVLGNGHQRKAYVHVEDLIDGILGIESKELFEVFNLGRSDYSTVRDSVKWMLEEWQINPEIFYESHDRGWVGDNPFLQLDVQKALEAGWKPNISIENAVKSTVRWLLENEWVFEENEESNKIET